MAEEKDMETTSQFSQEAENDETTTTTQEPKQLINGRKTSWAKLHRVDSLNLEAGSVSMPKKHASEDSWKAKLILAFQSVGVVYGDIGTSPLYVFESTFPNGIRQTEDVLGALSLIIYTLALIPLVKYVFIVIRANDHGDGGTFALYSLMCRYAKVSLIPNGQPEDSQVSNYKLDMPSNKLWLAQKIKEKLETSTKIKVFLFLLTILGTSMVIGDGVLTPSISVMSAVSGIKSLGQGAVIWITVVILIILFCIQRFGTDKVGSAFAPGLLLWFAFISGIGVYNVFKHDVTILRAFNPKYIIEYFKRNGKQGWISLGGVILCITGAEAMFADLGHFSVQAIQISFSSVVFPAILASYCGQAAYLSKHPEDVTDAFYKSVPNPVYWPTFVVAVAASIIASQALISGSFSIISQSLSLGCFPWVKVVHTSAKYEGQVYVPEVNYTLMIACVFVVLGFKSTTSIGNAYGIAVVSVMVITTSLVTLIMLVIWKTSIWWIALFFCVFMSIEGVYLSSVLFKFKQGGFLPLAFAFVLMIIMAIWHYVHKKRYMYELKNKVSSEYVRELATNPNIKRVPGIGLLYSELVQGIPPIFRHFIANIPSVHSVFVFVSIKHLPVSKVVLEERFLFRQVEPKGNRMFRCVVRYGYKDLIEDAEIFEKQLVQQLKEFIRHEHFISEAGSNEAVIEADNIQHSAELADHKRGSSTVHVEESFPQPDSNVPHRISSSGSIQSSNGIRSRNSIERITSSGEEEMQFVEKAMEKGVLYLLGEAEVVAESNSSFLKKFVVNYGYSFLRKNFRHGQNVLAIPRSKLLKVGMTYEI